MNDFNYKDCSKVCQCGECYKLLTQPCSNCKSLLQEYQNIIREYAELCQKYRGMIENILEIKE